ncbi:DUF2796 domain-containing protein [Loktanella sp. S4079]|uniref:DUF2796 domain-containing protein n=1 Tax=Loktanella sp. S4079 TaxID=579483 RepID=UPI0005FA2ED6|nr:DUF2796 domain-containing protein [Loktanella sp. S4079]KJZ18529.1 hypothetical protein TW80_13975 [Loktanella sp. S4079]
MKTVPLALITTLIAAPVLAQDTRALDAHVHGVSTLELAVEDGLLEIHLDAPGMDIVGFEYEPSSDTDKDAVAAAIRQLVLPENVVTLSPDAECRLTETRAHLHGDEEHHYDDDHHDHNHDEHEHDDHADDASHSEFSANYVFACAHPQELTEITFPFFDNFGNAQEIEVQYVTDAGAGAAEISRNDPSLRLNER